MYMLPWTTPQANGQDENINRTILDGLIKLLEEAEFAWYEELSVILWKYKTMPRRTNDETPFSMNYYCEARVPIEVIVPLGRVI